MAETKFNGSDAEDEGLSDEDFLKNLIYPPVYIWTIVIVLNCSVLVSGLVGNALVTWSVFRNRSMWSATNMLVGNLAISDFFVLILCLPPTMVWDITETWFLGDTICKIVPYFQVSLYKENIKSLNFCEDRKRGY